MSFVHGTVPHVMPFNRSDEQLLSAAELVLTYHDATATSPLCEGQQVVCHGDLGPHNTVFRGRARWQSSTGTTTSGLVDTPTTSRTPCGASRI